MELETKRFSLDGECPARRIRGLVTRPVGAGERPAVLIVHGFKGFIRWGFFPELAERIARAGHVALAINLSGSGVGEDLESFTEDEAFLRSTPSNDVEDLERVRLWLAGESLGVDPARLGILGHSRGGGTALLHAERARDYRAVVVWAPVSKTLRFSDEVLASWREKGVVEIPNARTGQVHRIARGWLDDAEENADALDIEAACARLTTPTLVVHGSADESVPFHEGQTLARLLPAGRLVPIERAGHTFGAVHPYRGSTPELERAFDATLAHLEEHLGT